MAKLIRAVAWRRLERPYTRKSKYRKLNFVRSVPHSKIVKFVMGDPRREFPVKVELKSASDIQLRHNALESARMSANRYLDKKIGKNQYLFRIRTYPHHILRNNPLAAGAGADRMSTGMARSFGKVVGIAARVRKGQTILEVECEKNQVENAKDALRRARNKFPCGCTVAVTEK